jgi:histone H3/H4
MTKPKSKRRAAAATPGPRKERDLIKSNTIRSYVTDVLNMRISASAANDLRGAFNALLKSTMANAVENAKAGGRSTIMPQDIAAAIDKTISKKNLTPADLAQEINRLSAVELGELVTAIEDIVKRKKETK